MQRRISEERSDEGKSSSMIEVFIRYQVTNGPCSGDMDIASDRIGARLYQPIFLIELWAGNA